MATVEWYPTGTDLVGSDWTNTSNFFAKDGALATCVTSVISSLRLIDFSGPKIPVGSTIDSVVLVVDRKVDHTGDMSSDGDPAIQYGVEANSVSLDSIETEEQGPLVANTLEEFSLDITSAAMADIGSPWSHGMLESAFVTLRVRNIGSAGPDTTFDFDDVRFVISYTAPTPGAMLLRKSDIAASGITEVYEKWGAIDCDVDSDPADRVVHVSSGIDGDWREVGPIGNPQGPQANNSWRKIIVMDGDDDGLGYERTEISHNSFQYGDEAIGNQPPDSPGHPFPSTTFALYAEGERHITVWSVFLPEDFPIDTPEWQLIAQQKQTGGANITSDPDSPYGSPRIAIEAREGEIQFAYDGTSNARIYGGSPVWATDAVLGIWMRIQIEAYYSADPDQGWIRITVDKTPDADSDPVIDQSPVMRRATLIPEEAGPDTTFAVGTGVSAHLRMGLYHNNVIPLPSGATEFSIGVDNVQNYLIIPPTTGPSPSGGSSGGSNVDVDYQIFVGDSTTMEKLADISQECREKSLTVALNRPGSFSGTVPMFSESYGHLNPVENCIIVAKNKVDVWSGPIWTKSEDFVAQKVQIGAVGWFQLLMKRFITSGIPTSSLTFSGVNDGTIAFALLDIANQLEVEGNMYPTGITAGTNTSASTRIKTYEYWQSIGQEIQALSDLEAGFDFYIDPVTKVMNIHGWNDYFNNTAAHFTLNFGLDNIGGLTRESNADDLENQTFVSGQYGTVEAHDLPSIETYGIHQQVINVNEISNTSILGAIANTEVAIKAQPRVTINFDPKMEGRSNIPELFADYNLGDQVYLTAIRDNAQILQQAIRIFGATLTLDNNNHAKVSQIQTTFQNT